MADPKKEELKKEEVVEKEPEGPARYKTRERCYLNDQLFEEGAEFTYNGIPGHYMTPLNDRAKWMKKKHGIGEQAHDPIGKLTEVKAP